MSLSMLPTELMALLEARGVRFGLRAGRLAIDAPHGVLTPEVRAAVVAQKSAIERLVRAASGLQPPLTPTALPCPARRCHTCRMRRWWQRPDGGWVCGVCHPPGANGIAKQDDTPIRLIDDNEGYARGGIDAKCG